MTGTKISRHKGTEAEGTKISRHKGTEAEGTKVIDYFVPLCLITLCLCAFVPYLEC